MKARLDKAIEDRNLKGVHDVLRHATDTGGLAAVIALLRQVGRSHGRTALHRAAEGGHTEIAMALLEAIEDQAEKAALLRQIDRPGRTALHWAAERGYTGTA